MDRHGPLGFYTFSIRIRIHLAHVEAEQDGCGCRNDPLFGAFDLYVYFFEGDAVVSQGQSLTRDTLAAQLRLDGYPMRNARVSALLHSLRADQLVNSAVDRDA